MPHTTYGLLKAIRSHQIDSPNVKTTLATGRPNACNLCHLDKTLEWTDQRMSKWYGHEPAELPSEHREVSAALIWLLKGDAGQRGLIAWAMSWPPALEASGADWIAPMLAQLLQDPYDAVRFVAWRSLRELPAAKEIEFDFLADSQQRDEAITKIVDRWRSESTNQKPRAATQLFDSDGQVQWERLNQLLDQRDDRKIMLVE